MGIKYVCPKCNRRFTEWGAERAGFKCPQDEHCSKDATNDIELVRVGSAEDKSSKRASLRRMARRAMPAPRVTQDDEAAVAENDEFEDEEEEQEEVETFAPVDDEDAEGFSRNPAETLLDDTDEADELDIESDELSFGEDSSAMPDEPIDESEDLGDDWHG